MKLIFIFFISFFSFSSFSQDFNYYKPLKAKGIIPKDFTTLSKDKVEEGMIDKRYEGVENKKVFIENTRFSIDRILQSGKVLFGDDLSVYVTQVFSEIKKVNAIDEKVRLYVLQSNAANAFSTDQGLIFITTGLIAQFNNEAELAFVLCHELAHYTENHGLETYQKKIDLESNVATTRSKLKSLSNYSKENELEADRIGLDYFNKLNYAIQEIKNIFNVLKYSELPFDIFRYKPDWITKNKYDIPDKYCVIDSDYSLDNNEESSDEFASHPTLLSRELTLFKDIDMELKVEPYFYVSQQKFEYIRTLARFEKVRTNVIEHHSISAIYEINLLREELGESYWLDLQEIKAWASTIESNSNKSGASALNGEIKQIQSLLRKMKRSNRLAYTLRLAYDFKAKYPNDKVAPEILSKLFQFQLSKEYKLKLDDLYSEELTVVVNKNIQAFNKKDSIISTEKDDDISSKYDKIKSRTKSKVNVAKSEKKLKQNIKNIELDFGRYLFYDIIDDKHFKLLFTLSSSDDAYLVETKSTRRKGGIEEFVLESELKQTKILVVNPMFIYYDETDGIQNNKTDKTSDLIQKSIVKTAKMNDQEIELLLFKGINEMDVEKYNDLNSLIDYLGFTDENTPNLLFDEVKPVLAKYNTNYIMYNVSTTIVRRGKKKSTIITLIFDAKESQLCYSYIAKSPTRVNKTFLLSHFYHQFEQMKKANN